MPPARRSQLARVLGYSSFGLAGTLWFFRFVVISRFDEIPGSIGDTRFLIYICEHWHKVFQGTAPWLSPAFFYPIKGVLGYSDALFLYAVPFSALRSFGFDSYTSFQLVVFVLAFVGYIGTVWLLRSTFRLGRCAAIVGAILFAFSSPLATSIGHEQLQSVVFVPYLALLLCDYLRNLSDRKARISGLVFSVFFPLLAYTSFYVAWYFAVFVLLVGILTVLWLTLTHQQKELFAWLHLVSKNWLSIAANVVVCMLCSLPFLITYLPVLRLFPGRTFLEVLPMLPQPIDLINVGFDNAIWGRALHAVAPTLQSRPLFWELDKGVSPVVLVVFIASGLLAWFEYRRRRPLSDVLESSFTSRMVILCSVAVCLFWVLMLRWGAASAWSLVFNWVPGASAVRAVYRFNIFLMLPVAVVVAYGVDWAVHRLSLDRNSIGRLALGLLIAVMLIEQCDTFHRDILSKALERSTLQRVPAPPANCVSMVIMAEKAPYPGWWAPVQISSMVISQRFNIPTINGFSGWTPKEWSLNNPTDPGYREQAMNWAKEHKVSAGLCSYQIETRTWKPLSEPIGVGKESNLGAATADAKP